MAFVNGMITTVSDGNDTKFFGLPASGSGSYTNKLLLVLLTKEALVSGQRHYITHANQTKGNSNSKYRNMSDCCRRRNGGKSKFDNC